jgi:hypothetical protein
MSDDELFAVLSEIADEEIMARNRASIIEVGKRIRRDAFKEAHSVCLGGVKWSPEPPKQAQFYINGTCHRLAAEISHLARH